MFGAEDSFLFFDMGLVFGSFIGFWIITGAKKSKISILIYCLTALIILFVNAYPDRNRIFIEWVSMLLMIGGINLVFFLDKIDKRRAARKAAEKNDSER